MPGGVVANVIYPRQVHLVVVLAGLPSLLA